MSYIPYLEQDYEKIKNQCLQSGKLFEDPYFPPNDSSIFRCNKFLDKNSVIFWKRAKEICSDPKFIVNGIDPGDLGQGKIGDCWFLAAVANLLTETKYVEKVIPIDQTFNDSQYAGVFHFRFWINGNWHDVVIDDFLPCDENYNLIFGQNKFEKNEMFGPLLEKAYAKVNICYEFLIGGFTKNALIDMTGGVSQTYFLKSGIETSDESQATRSGDQIWEILYESFWIRASLSSCGINKKIGQLNETLLPNRLAVTHAYSIIGVFEIKYNDGKYDSFRGLENETSSQNIKLLLVRNPWSLDISYNGKWSIKRINDWNQLSSSVKRQLYPEKQNKGTFFISLEDFLTNFDILDIVHTDLNPIFGTENNNWTTNIFTVNMPFSPGCGASPEITTTIHQEYNKVMQSISANKNAIISKNANIEESIEIQLPRGEILLLSLFNKDLSFWQNVNFQLNFLKDEKIIVSLIQTDLAKKRYENKGEYHLYPFGFSIFSINPNAMLNDGNYKISDLTEVYQLKKIRIDREINKVLLVKAGKYLIIPYCYFQGVKVEFVLRVFVKNNETYVKMSREYYLAQRFVENFALDLKLKKIDDQDNAPQSSYCTIS